MRPADGRALASDSVMTRAIKRNVVYLRKATEYALCHQELAVDLDEGNSAAMGHAAHEMNTN